MPREKSAVIPTVSRGRVERVLLHPLVVFFVTFGVRCVLYMTRYSTESFLASDLVPHPSLVDVVGGDAAVRLPDASQPAYRSSANAYAEHLLTPPPFQFSLSIPVTEAATWRELVFWRRRGFTAEVPHYLQALAPWYAKFIPSLLATAPYAGVMLSVMDGCTAALLSQWPSATAMLLYGFFAVNPIMVYVAVSESLTSFEFLLLTLTIQLCVRSSTSVAAYGASLFCACFLGSPFVAMPMILLAPLGTPSCVKGLAGGAILAVGVGAYALTYLYATEVSYRSTSLYAPPDNGVMWYVRQLILSPFQRCLEMVMLQLAPMLLIPITVAFPKSYVRPSPSASSHPHLFSDGRAFLLLLAESLSILFRPQLTLPYCCLVVLHFYSALNVAATKSVTLEDQRVVTYSAYRRVRVLVPIFIQLTSAPLQVSFYAGWALRETVNANWKFFSDIAFMIGATTFVVLWYTEVIEDALHDQVEARGFEDVSPTAKLKTE